MVGDCAIFAGICGEVVVDRGCAGGTKGKEKARTIRALLGISVITYSLFWRM